MMLHCTGLGWRNVVHRDDQRMYAATQGHRATARQNRLARACRVDGLLPPMGGSPGFLLSAGMG
jgi:hypothetical protein